MLSSKSKDSWNLYYECLLHPIQQVIVLQCNAWYYVTDERPVNGICAFLFIAIYTLVKDKAEELLEYIGVIGRVSNICGSTCTEAINKTINIERHATCCRVFM